MQSSLDGAALKRRRVEPAEQSVPPPLIRPNYELSGTPLWKPSSSSSSGASSSSSGAAAFTPLRWRPQPGIMPQPLLERITASGSDGLVPLRLLIDVLIGDLTKAHTLCKPFAAQVQTRQVELLPRRLALAVTKDGSLQGAPIPLWQQGVLLLGRDRLVTDVPLDHLSCSSQHAVIANMLLLDVDDDDDEGDDEAESSERDTNKNGSLSLPVSLSTLEKSIRRLLEKLPQLSDDDLSSCFDVVPHLWDCGSTHGTTIGGKAVKGGDVEGTPLRVGDVIAFAFSSRKYVVVKQ